MPRQSDLDVLRRRRAIGCHGHDADLCGGVRHLVDPNNAPLALDDRAVMEGAIEAVRAHGGAAGRVLQDDAGVVVDSSLADRRHGAELRQGVPAEGQGRPLQHVAADVQQTAACQVLGPEPMRQVRPRRLETKIRAHMQRPTQGAAVQEVLHAPDNGEAPRPETLHQEDALLLRGSDQLLDLPLVHPHRLLHEDVLAGLEEQQGVLHVFRVYGANIHDSDLPVIC
mmetsp:Transcript_33570/g.101346  ORF Transcript_33570/g.101346 Transcript_33570/m.101346 type:complete len:225 (-) Transcript_33570:266-940(-)